MKSQEIENNETDREAHTRAKFGYKIILANILTAIGGCLLLNIIDIVTNFESTSHPYVQVGGQSIVIVLIAFLIYFVLKEKT